MSRYAAFISYSHADQARARWLHRALETYRLPRKLVGSDSAFGPVPRRLPPVFRDRDELPASGDLGGELRAALAESRFQIVVCSPRAAQSKWVNEEILSFKRAHGESRTLALITAGEPYAGGEQECFPPALRFRLAPDGTLSDTPAEPIAADIRPGKDGRRLALLKLIAGLTGVKLDALARRDSARRQRRLAYLAGISLAIAVLTIGLAVYADAQRRVAERQRRLADKSLELVIGTFAIANPATENPRTITALTILDRMSKRAEIELRGEPAVTARLLQTTGEIYFNLGLLRESERDLRAALALQPARGEGRARALLELARLACQRGDARRSTALVDAAARSYDRRALYAPPLTARLAEQRAQIDYLAGRYAAAANRFEEATDRYRKLTGDNREEVGRSQMGEANALMQLKQYDKAGALFAKVVAIYTAKFGISHFRTAAAIQNQAFYDFERGRYGPAEQRIGVALAVYDKVLERDHPARAAAFVLQGRIRDARNDKTGAVAAFDQARGIYERLYGARNAAVGDVDFYAAEAAGRAGDTALALDLTRRIKRIYDASYGPDDPDQVELLMLRARIYSRAGRPRDTSASCEAGLALQARLDPHDSTSGEARQTCGELLKTAIERRNSR